LSPGAKAVRAEGADGRPSGSSHVSYVDAMVVARPTSVPFFDPAPMHAPLREQILDDVASLLDRGDFVNGAAVAEFEDAFAQWVGTQHGVGTASGLDALRLGLLALGIQAGDEVLVPANTFVATLEAVTQSGGRPVLVDVAEHDLNIDVGAAEAAIGPSTRFIVPVHLYGQLADMRRVREIAHRHKLTVLEDACQAQGAERDGLRAGACGDAAAFSFYPAKNLGAIGDAGALVTDDIEVRDRVRALREHGQRAKYKHAVEGYTARLDTIQALALLRKLPHLDEWTAQRRTAAQWYAEALADVAGVETPHVPAGSDPVWHLYVIRTTAPESVASYLREHGIGTGRHYPEPAHLSEAYAWLGHRQGAFPVTEQAAATTLSLPIFPGITQSQVAYVADRIRDYFDD
jgi:dTDP-4-amino-4,6-dideoxygalactose transaminase